MKKELCVKAILIYTASLLAALSAGVVNGLLGTGGGIILTYIYRAMLKNDPKAPFTAAMMSVIPISFISLFTYDTPLLRDVPLLISLAVPSAIGGIIGAVLSTRAKPRLLEMLFAAVTIFAGVRMLL